MSTIEWLLRHSIDVPRDDSWLSAAEQQLQARFVVPKRRADWRLGRWTAKAALAAALGVDRSRISIAVAADGAPEPLLDGAPIHEHGEPLSLSISHREDTGLAVVGRRGIVVGGDLEVVEPRSDAFVQEWFSPAEQDLVAGSVAAGRRNEMACLVWSAKEAAAKVLREGLRLDVRQATVSLDAAAQGGRWSASSVEWRTEERVIPGWWRIDGTRVVTIASDHRQAVPIRLQ